MGQNFRVSYDDVLTPHMQAVVNHVQNPAYKGAKHRAVVNHEQYPCVLLSAQHGPEEEELCSPLRHQAFP